MFYSTAIAAIGAAAMQAGIATSPDASPVIVTQPRDSYPAISPDGTQIVFTSNRSGSQAIWLVDADGNTPHMLFDGTDMGTYPSSPRWSPDGSQILFAMKPSDAVYEDESDIYLMTLADRSVARLTTAPSDDSHPKFNRDGTRVYFNSARATPDLSADWGSKWIDIYSMATDGSDVQRHTYCRTRCTYPSLSPDERYLTYRKVYDTPGRHWDQDEAARNSEVAVLDLDSGEERNVSNSEAYDGWPGWTPDSQWVIFASNRQGVPNVGSIYRVRPDGSGLEIVENDAMSLVQASVAPDGASFVAFRNIEEGDYEIGHIARYVFPADAR